MKLKLKTGVSLLLSMIMFTAVGLCGLPVSAATPVQPDPVVQSEKQTVLKGSPFAATFNFIHDNYTSRGSVYKIVINVSSSNTAISLGKKTFTYVSNPSDITELNPIDKIGEDSYIFAYQLVIPEKYLRRVGDGAGTFKFTINYYDANGKRLDTFMVQKTVFDAIGTGSTTEQDGKLSVQSYRVDHSPIKEGEKFNLIVSLKNNGTAACNNVMAVLDASTAEGISINGVTDTQYISSIDAGATLTITYPMTCLSKMTTNNYALSLILSADELSKSISSKVFVPVTGTKADKEDTTKPNASKPLIIIESYDYGGKAVTGGKEFNLIMRFKNTNTATQIENLKITVSSVAGTDDKSVGGAFTPAKSSNTFFIAKAGPGSTFTEQIALIPKADATPNSYGVSIAFNYEAVLDGKREAVEATETISIPLTQPDRFEANAAELQTPMYFGQPGQLTINYVNKGKSKIFNLSVKLEGNFTSGESNSYIGNVDSGLGDSFQATLNPAAEGTLTGKATFSYEDANGTTKNVVKDFTCEVMPLDVPTDGGLISEPTGVPGKGGDSSSPWMIWLIIGGAVVAAAVLFVIIHKKRKAKKLRLLEDTDDYDDPTANEGK
jgi:hypothetical protein